MYKSLTSSLFKENENSKRLKMQLEEERKAGQTSLSRAVYWDFARLTDFKIIRDLKKTGRSGMYLFNKDVCDTNFAFYQVQNSDQR